MYNSNICHARSKNLKNVAILNTCITGSTGKIASGLHEKLVLEGYNSYFCYGREDSSRKQGYYKIGNVINKYIHAGLAKLFGLQGIGSVIPTKLLISFFENKSIDTLFIVSPHGYYLNEKILFTYTSKRNINIVYIMIDEYAYLGNCAYSNGCEGYMDWCRNCTRRKYFSKLRFLNSPSIIFNIKQKSYQANNMIFVGPQYTIEKAKKSPLLSNKKLILLDEAVNTDLYIPQDTNKLRSELGICDDQMIILCIAPFSYKRKGCRYFVELARRFENNRKYVFVHVGFDVNPNSVNLPRNYIKIGYIKDQNTLAQYYSLGDLFVFPSVLDTMPNACLEALSAGTPLLLFNISGMPYIADNTVATFVEAGDVDSMVKVIENTSYKNEIISRKCREYALRRYDNKTYYDKLINIGENFNFMV